MCGIAGWLSLNGAPPTRGGLQAMLDAIAHRGPDGQGLWADARAGLAHARLSLVDLTGGAQPMGNEDDSVQVVFNGEIYNYLELRDDLLRRGHVLRTASDTEVIVHLYEEQGERFVESLNGPFAIALWDTRRQRLVLARDRVGMRPLFHARFAGRWAFASEIKALMALPGCPRTLDVQAMAEVFSFWTTLGPRTPFAGIDSLPPGHVLSLSADGGSRMWRYWDWSFDEVAPADATRADAWADELQALLSDAVRLQLRADVPVGAYLSGGLDSSVIAVLLRQLAATHTPCFSLAFEAAGFDETPAQREMAGWLGGDWHSVTCRAGDVAANFARTVWHAETPLVRTAAAPMMQLSALVRSQGCKTVLSGEGADEVLAGYDLFKEAQLRRFVARQPGSARRQRLFERLYGYLPHSPVRSASLAGAFFGVSGSSPGSAGFAHGPRIRATQRSWALWTPELRERLAPWQAQAELEAIVPSTFEAWPGLARDQYVEAHTLLSGYLLSSQGDRPAMAHAVEVRHPFLDHRVIEFANRLPPNLKLRGLTEKYVLRQALRGRMPETIRRRSKQPYRAPDSASFFDADGHLAACAQEALDPDRLRAAGLFDGAAVGRLVDKCRSGRAIGFADNMAFVGVLSTMLLHSQFIARLPVVSAREG